MEDRAVQSDPLSELESRQDDVLRRLEELGRRVETALAEWLAEKGTSKEKQREDVPLSEGVAAG